MLNSILLGRTFFEDKMIVRKAIEDAKIPFTYICSNCSMGYFIAGLCEAGKLLPSRESVSLHGDGNVKAIFVEEDDIAKYSIKTIDDPRTLNKTLFINPPENIMTQCEVVEIWEALIGRELQKASVSREDFLNGMKDFNPAVQVGFCHYYNVFHEGCLTNFEIDDYGEEASKLYPEVNYTRVKEFLEHYV
uniref:(+)-lariciresinol reductase n=1 Tax=Anthurium amnicola TaxID=1678845 RepID=A0A1D1ZK43_9ARAE